MVNVRKGSGSESSGGQFEMRPHALRPSIMITRIHGDATVTVRIASVFRKSTIILNPRDNNMSPPKNDCDRSQKPS
jgi:hypothetical protein